METLTPEQYKALARKKTAWKRRPEKHYVEGENPLEVLMNPRSIPMNAKVKPEDRLSILLRKCCARLQLHNLMEGIFTAVVHESKAHEFTELIDQQKGKVPGATDWFFGAPFTTAVIELKVHPNTLRNNQMRFRDWCKMRNVPWACYVLKEDTPEARRETVTLILHKLHEWRIIPNIEAALAECQSLLRHPFA